MSKAIEAELNLYEKERLKRIQQVRRDEMEKPLPSQTRNDKEAKHDTSEAKDHRAETHVHPNRVHSRKATQGMFCTT